MVQSIYRAPYFISFKWNKPHANNSDNLVTYTLLYRNWGHVESQCVGGSLLALKLSFYLFFLVFDHTNLFLHLLVPFVNKSSKDLHTFLLSVLGDFDISLRNTSAEFRHCSLTASAKLRRLPPQRRTLRDLSAEADRREATNATINMQRSTDR